MKLKFAKPKKEKLTMLKKKADIAFSKALRTIIGYCQAEGKVRNCKCGGGLQLAHIQGRGNKNLRYDPMNILILCAGHHRWFHSNVFQFIEFLLKYYPNQYNYVMKYKNDMCKLTASDYHELIDHYTVQYEQFISQKL